MMETYYQKNKQKILDRVKNNYKENGGKEKQNVRSMSKKQKAVEFFNSTCLDCGLKSEYLEVYEFHHTDPHTKEKGIGDLRTRSWKVIEEELKKCVMLCANCHRIRHAKEKISSTHIT